jgi:hypothetical protein
MLLVSNLESEYDNPDSLLKTEMLNDPDFLPLESPADGRNYNPLVHLYRSLFYGNLCI